MDEKIKKKIDEAWSGQWGKKASAPRNDWWDSPHIIRHINKTICGEELEGWNAGPIKLLRQVMPPDHILDEAVSVGCGTALKEMHLLQEGLVRHFTCFDLSETAIALAKEAAEERGLSDRILLLQEDFFESEYADMTYDMVFWDNSLHHMLDASYAIQKSYDILNDGGVFFCHDYVGKNRFQLSDIELAIINGVRVMLPDSIFQMDGETRFGRRVVCPSWESMVNMDPSEAADSQAILPGIARVFPEALVIPTGGLIYFGCLGGILNQIDEGSPLLEYLLSMDDEVTRMGLTIYAFALAVK